MSKRTHDANELLEQEVAKDGDFMDIPYSHGGLGTVQKTCSESYGLDGFPGASGKHPQRPTSKSPSPNSSLHMLRQGQMS
jgi:hypothetical protein